MSKPKIKFLRFYQIGAPAIRPRWYRLKERVYYGFRIDGVFVEMIFAPGAEWDGGSIPRFAWSVLGLAPGDILAESLIHDALCRIHREDWPKWFNLIVHNNSVKFLRLTPYIRDHLFRECMKKMGVLRRRARIAWFCVVLKWRFECWKLGIKYK